MSLRIRTISIFILSIAISTLMAVLVSRYFFLQSFDEIEEAESREMLNHAQALMDDDLDQLEITVIDWAVWDDTYDFILNGTQGYISSNLQKATFEGLGLSGFFLFDPDYKLVFGYENDQGLGKAIIEAYTPASTRKSGSEQPQDNQNDGTKKQLIPAGNNLHLAVGKSIQPNEGLVPGSGLLIMVRALDDERALRYSRLLGVPVTVSLAIEGQIPLETLNKSDEFITAFLGLHSDSDYPAGILSVKLPRTISKHGTRYLSLYLVSVMAALGSIALISLLILETMVFRQLRTIGSQLHIIASGKDPNARVYLPQGDEIGLLAEMMNRSLDTLQTRMKEREFMLREIHHRVKNNLQIIASLLNLQSCEEGALPSSHALSEGRRRVLAMAFIHDELYSELDLSTIDLGHFLDGFSRSFEPESSCYGVISRELVFDTISIEIDQAVPIGLILSEALANCYQHAFPEGRDGSIFIETKAEVAEDYILVVRDDGIGLKSDGSHRSGLGLSLIDALAAQLLGRASLETLPEGGTVFCLRFPRRREKDLA